MATVSDEFAEFFAARALRMRRVAFTVLGDWRLADDVVHTAFVRLRRAWPRLRRESVDAYVRRSVVRTSLAMARKRSQVPAVDAAPRGTAPADTSGQVVLDVLRELSPTQRAVVALRFVDDLTVASTARVLGISEEAVESHASGALQALRDSASLSTSTTIQGRQP